MIYQTKSKSSRVITVGNKYDWFTNMDYGYRLKDFLSASDKKELQTKWTVLATDGLTQWQS